jgi:hypothetical protein
MQVSPAHTARMNADQDFVGPQVAQLPMSIKSQRLPSSIQNHRAHGKSLAQLATASIATDHAVFSIAISPVASWHARRADLTRAAACDFGINIGDTQFFNLHLPQAHGARLRQFDPAQSG